MHLSLTHKIVRWGHIMTSQTQRLREQSHFCTLHWHPGRSLRAWFTVSAVQQLGIIYTLVKEVCSVSGLKMKAG